MMKGLELFHLCRRISGIPLNRGIHSGAVLLQFRRRRKINQYIPDEPGIRRRRENLEDALEDPESIQHEGDLEGEVDMMNIDKAYDLNEREKRMSKIKLQQVITAKKFFSPRPQPLMLTCNERECIRYLHKQDPVQWDVKTLSESFPATTEVIKKIIKQKWKITLERAKILDSRAQKNWELLSQGKLEADPNVLEHLQKFINRREVLLEQINNMKFYLPEIKREPIWNNGEFSNVLGKYEKSVQKLIEETELQQEPKMLKDGIEKCEKEDDKSSLDKIHSKIEKAASKKLMENKDSFLFGDVTKYYSKHRTLEDLEEHLLKKADSNKKLGVMDKAILETKLNVNTKHNLEYSQETELPTERIKEEDVERLESKSKCFARTDLPQHRHTNYNKKKDEMYTTPEYVPPDERTETANETGVGKLLQSIKNSPKPVVKTEKQINVINKPKIDFSDPERLERENIYYNKEVKDIENTAFWNTGRSSKEKALAESEKRPHDGPFDIEHRTNSIQTSILSQDVYPERIKIPKNKQGSGLTFKVKDCYYDDDGEFLYRVPGMVK